MVLGREAPHKTIVNSLLFGFKLAYGGLWVGGRVTLTESNLEFSPNRVNHAAHKELHDISIPLKAVTSVSMKTGVVTKIIVIESSQLTFKVRCYGAENFAEQIRAASSGLQR